MSLLILDLLPSAIMVLAKGNDINAANQQNKIWQIIWPLFQEKFVKPNIRHGIIRDIDLVDLDPPLVAYSGVELI